MDEDFFDADDFDGTDDDFVDPLADDGDCLDEDCPDEDGEDSWDEEAELAEAFNQDEDPATDAPARSEEVKSGFDALDALILGTMVAGVASDGTRPARRGKRGPNRT